MTLSGRPLLDTRSDAALFVDRVDELSRIGRALDGGFNCLVTGERGIGKTSLLRSAIHRMRQGASGGHQLRYVRGAAATDAHDLLNRVGAAVLDRSEEGAGRSIEQILASLDQAIGQRPADAVRPVIVLDDPPSAAGNALFGSLRDELWALGLRWLVAVPTDEATALLRPPADAFFEIRIDLQPLEDSAAAELLDRRIGEAPADFIREAVRLAGGHPRRLLDIAREISPDGAQWPEKAAAIAAREQALTKVGRPATMLAKALEAMGGASASDGRLLDRMGWTRPRVVQVLGELEEAGLVQRQPVRTGENGRPRMVYTLVPATAFARSRAGSGQ